MSSQAKGLHMPITSETDGPNATCVIDGRFDAHETPSFRSFVDEFHASRPGEALRLRVVLARTTFIDSSGLAELVRAMKQLTAGGGGGGIVLVEPADPVLVILELTRLSTMFEIEEAATLTIDTE